MGAELDALSVSEAVKFFGLSVKMTRRYTHNAVISGKQEGGGGFFSQAE